MLDVSQVDRCSGQDWPYTEKQMEEKFALQEPAQQLYPPAGRRGRGATRVRLTFDAGRGRARWWRHPS